MPPDEPELPEDPELPDEPEPYEPEPVVDPELLLGESCRSICDPGTPLVLLLPGSWLGNCAVWQAGRGSLGRQSAGA